MKSITHILKVSEQGVNRPVRCMADDGNYYWCKGLQSGYTVIVNEWVAGSIAKRLGLPIPEFEPLFCSEALSEEWVNAGKSDNDIRERLSSSSMNVVFASKEIPYPFDVRNVTGIENAASRRLFATIYLFDRLVKNTDRTDYNSNILRSGSSNDALYIIDHSNAFSPDFKDDEFCDLHIFRNSYTACTATLRKEIIEKFCKELTQEFVTSVWDEMPDVWKEEFGPHSLTLDLLQDTIFNRLEII